MTTTYLLGLTADEVRWLVAHAAYYDWPPELANKLTEILAQVITEEKSNEGMDRTVVSESARRELANQFDGGGLNRYGYR